MLQTLECICTWFDLYQKSKNLSKRSTRLIGFLRILLRVFAIIIGTFLFLVYALPSIPTMGKTLQLASDFSTWVPAACTVICGPLISRVLCKDIKDITNPNWKASAAIRETAIVYLVCLAAWWLCLEAIVKWGLWGTWAPVMNNSFSLGLFGSTMMSNWSWYQYLLFTNRRSLEEYDLQSIHFLSFVRKIISKDSSF